MPVFIYSNRILLVAFLCCIFFESAAQEIVDSCFTSVEKVGMYAGSDDLKNICLCSEPYLSSDLIEWTPDGQWKGRLPNNPTLDLPPPPNDGCQTRGIWMGSEMWTERGEAFGLRLSKPLEGGKTYRYSFTYAADGFKDEPGFEPILYSAKTPNLYFATPIDTLPPANNFWITNAVTFTASTEQNGHTWLILHTVHISGTILSNCKNKNLLKGAVLPDDTVLCARDTLTLQLPEGKNIEYVWSTQSTTSSLQISKPGTYGVEASYLYCHETDTISVSPIDCEVRLIMPNVFTPNGDELNQLFIPKEYNYIKSGTSLILNRWGNEIFSGNLFTGWDGKIEGSEAATGIYYYRIFYIDPKEKTHEVKGTVTLIR